MNAKDEKLNRVISTSEALEILEKRKKDGDLGYEQQVSYEHIKKFAKIEKSKAEKLKKELEELGLSEKCAIQLIDILPIDMLQLKQVLATEKMPPEQDIADKVLKLIDINRGKS